MKVTDSAESMIGTTAELKSKTWVKLSDVLYGAMLPSGNDAALLLSEYIGYFNLIEKKRRSFLQRAKFIDISNESATLCTVEFVKMMNRKAENIGLKFTKFSNPHGLQNAMNISCAKDLILLSRFCSKNDTFREIMNT